MSTHVAQICPPYCKGNVTKFLAFKGLTKIIYFLLLSLFTSTLNAQIICGNDDSETFAPPSVMPTCSNADVDYTPVEEDAEKVIRINVHVMQKEDPNDPQNFQDIQAHTDFLVHIFDYLMNNHQLNPINAPLYGGPTNDPYVEDSKVRVSLQNIYFVQDDDGWDNNGSMYSSYYQNHSINPDCVLNVFLCEVSGSGQPTGIGNSDGVILNQVYSRYLTDPTYPTREAYLFGHELGHVLGLRHSWCPNEYARFPDIYFPQCGPIPQQCPHPENPCTEPEDSWCFPGTAEYCVNNFMSYSTVNNFLSPLQLGRINKNLIHGFQSKFLEVEYDENMTIVIEEDETWEVGKFITGDIIVTEGNRLTITCKVLMPPGGRIIVERGAELHVDGGWITIASRCNDLWQGIVVLGDSDENQFAYNGNGDRYQGKVEIINDAIIENAITGVSLFDIDNPVGTTGGIIIATTNSTFKNCGQAVHFRPYTNYYSIGNPTFNYSYFKDCTFTVDDEILTHFHQHLYLEGVSGIQIIACDLENVKNSAYQRGNGIYAVDAHFNLQGKCTSGIPCSQWKRPTVKGFTNGIRAENSGMSIHAFRVDRTDFDNNFIGIYSSAVNNLRVTRSDFKVGLGIFTYQPAGICINNGTGYMVENNNFTGTLGLGNTSIGVWVRETGNDNNEIYQNTFDGFFAANLSNGDNRNEDDPFLGLHFFCNENQDNVFDFSVPYEPPNEFGESPNGIAQNQGFFNEAAGNKFSFNPGDNESDFFNQSPWTVNYFYYKDDPDQIPEDYTIPLVSISEAGQAHDCTVNYPDVPEEPQEEPELPDKTSQFNDNSGLYNGRVTQREALIDDGDTPSLVNTINNFLSAGTQLKADLLDISPYLSYNALVAAADRYDILSHADVYDIMAANPDESRQEPLLEYLETKSNPMPSNMVDSLRNQSFTVTARTILENQIAYHAVEKESAANFILHHYLTDTTGLQMDSILFWLDNKGGLTSEYIKVDAYLHDRDTTAAIQQLDSIAQNYTLSADQTTELGYFSDLKHLQVNLLRGGRTILECDSAEVEELIQIAGSSRWLAGQQAQNILNFGYGHDSIPAPILPELSGGVRLADQRLKNNTPSVTYAFPNPADNLVTFQYSLPEADARCFIQVFDRYGREIITLPVPQKQGFIDWNTKEVREGLYFYSITNGKKVIGSGKVVIAH